ncbi:MAG: CaiB/BaiF CoA-transferase family protein [Pseudomonadota bacterium]
MAQPPLSGLRIVEIAGLGPTPFAAMCLADFGAEVIRVERPGLRHLLGLEVDILDRSRQHVALDLKTDVGVARVRELIARADGLIEGLRPGVMERLGLGPEAAATLNPRLVYGRMTGWGQSGPRAPTAGHDINYIALSGALHAIGPADTPVVPLNLIGDFGGGGIYLAFGMLAALWDAAKSGRGQVVDAAITDGTAHLMAMVYGMAQGGAWTDRRGANVLDGAAPFYGIYRCACGGFVAVGAIEPKFYRDLVAGLDLAPGATEDLVARQHDRAAWPAARATLEAAFAGASRDVWAKHFDGTDACVAPVLTIAEAYGDAHNAARGTFETASGIHQPAPAPRLSRTPGRIGATGAADIDDILSRWSIPHA